MKKMSFELIAIKQGLSDNNKLITLYVFVKNW